MNITFLFLVLLISSLLTINANNTCLLLGSLPAKLWMSSRIGTDFSKNKRGSPIAFSHGVLADQLTLSRVLTFN